MFYSLATSDCGLSLLEQSGPCNSVSYLLQMDKLSLINPLGFQVFLSVCVALLFCICGAPTLGAHSWCWVRQLKSPRLRVKVMVGFRVNLQITNISDENKGV